MPCRGVNRFPGEHDHGRQRTVTEDHVLNAPRDRVLVPVLAATLAALAGCGDDGPTEPPEPVVASVRVSADASVEVVNGTPTIAVGDSADFDATATDEQGMTVDADFAWSSVDPAVATVNDTGTAIGVAPGQTGIVASVGGVSDTTMLVVQDSSTTGDVPNLRAASLDLLPRGVLTSGTIEAEAVVENRGLDAGPYRLEVREGSRVLASASRDGLAADGVDTVAIGELGPFPEGAHTLTLRVDVDNEVSEGDESDNSVDARLESHSAGYDIELQFLGRVSATLQNEIRSNLDRWSRVVTSDIDDVQPDSLNLDDCFSGDPGFGIRTQPIDDLLILVQADSIDGSGGTLARAGPCFIRVETTDPELPPHPVVGVMQFDTADLDNARSGGFLNPVILHEIAHVLGFGSLWNFNGEDGLGPFQLRSGTGGTDPRFLGALAIDRYQAIGGEDATVPVEGRPSQAGTRDAHWRESVFGDELMTGFISRGENPMSSVTIGSLGDMFYAIDLSEADPFSLETGGAAAVRLAPIELGDHLWDDGPLFGIDERGRVHRLDRSTLRPR